MTRGAASFIRRVLLPLLALASGAWAVPARGDDRAACSAAYVAAQTRRGEHKLLAARDELRTCARRECSSLMQGQIIRDCTEWLARVEESIPSVVLSAKDDAGADLTSVAVAIDGAVVATKLDGRAIDIDPGSHTFVFDPEPPPDATGPSRGRSPPRPASVTVTALVLEGAKNQLVRATFGRSAPEEATGTSPAPAEARGSSTANPAAMTDAAPAREPMHPNRALVVSGIVSLSVGYVGAIVGATAVLASQSSTGSTASSCLGSSGLALIPLIGPLLTLGTYPNHQVISYGPPASGMGGSQVIQVADCDGGRSVFTEAVVLDEVLQLGGLALITSGLLLRSAGETAAANHSARMALLPGASGAPLGATLRIVGL